MICDAFIRCILYRVFVGLIIPVIMRDWSRAPKGRQISTPFSHNTVFTRIVSFAEQGLSVFSETPSPAPWVLVKTNWVSQVSAQVRRLDSGLQQWAAQPLRTCSPCTSPGQRKSSAMKVVGGFDRQGPGGLATQRYQTKTENAQCSHLTPFDITATVQFWKILCEVILLWPQPQSLIKRNLSCSADRDQGGDGGGGLFLRLP